MNKVAGNQRHKTVVLPIQTLELTPPLVRAVPEQGVECVSPSALVSCQKLWCLAVCGPLLIGIGDFQ